MMLVTGTLGVVNRLEEPVTDVTVVFGVERSVEQLVTGVIVVFGAETSVELELATEEVERVAFGIERTVELVLATGEELDTGAVVLQTRESNQSVSHQLRVNP
jgi:hypothetical protein